MICGAMVVIRQCRDELTNDAARFFYHYEFTFNIMLKNGNLSRCQMSWEVRVLWTMFLVIFKNRSREGVSGTRTQGDLHHVKSYQVSLCCLLIVCCDSRFEDIPIKFSSITRNSQIHISCTSHNIP